MKICFALLTSFFMLTLFAQTSKTKNSNAITMEDIRINDKLKTVQIGNLVIPTQTVYETWSKSDCAEVLVNVNTKSFFQTQDQEKRGYSKQSCDIQLNELNQLYKICMNGKLKPELHIMATAAYEGCVKKLVKIESFDRICKAYTLSFIQSQIASKPIAPTYQQKTKAKKSQTNQ